MKRDAMTPIQIAAAIHENCEAYHAGRRTHEDWGAEQRRLWDLAATQRRGVRTVTQIVCPVVPRHRVILAGDVVRYADPAPAEVDLRFVVLEIYDGRAHIQARNLATFTGPLLPIETVAVADLELAPPEGTR